MIHIEDNALGDEDDDDEYNDKSPLFDHLVIIFSVLTQVRHDTEELHPSKCCTTSSWRRRSREEEDERGPGGGREVRLHCFYFFHQYLISSNINELLILVLKTGSPNISFRPLPCLPLDLLHFCYITLFPLYSHFKNREPQYFIPTSSTFAPGSLPKRLPTEDIFKVIMMVIL